jgi:hypothetical protein
VGECPASCLSSWGRDVESSKSRSFIDLFFTSGRAPRDIEATENH